MANYTENLGTQNNSTSVSNVPRYEKMGIITDQWILDAASTLEHTEVSVTAYKKDPFDGPISCLPIMQKGFRFFITGVSKSIKDINGELNLLHYTDIVAADFSVAYSIPNFVWSGVCRDIKGVWHTPESLCTTNVQKEALAYKDVTGYIPIPKTGKRLLEKNGIGQCYEIANLASYECPLRGGSTYWEIIFAIIKVG
jgi:hypothetical protein